MVARRLDVDPVETADPPIVETGRTAMLDCGLDEAAPKLDCGLGMGLFGGRSGGKGEDAREGDEGGEDGRGDKEEADDEGDNDGDELEEKESFDVEGESKEGSLST